ncbi:hypothetical protein EJ05DRAFT_481638 [Pseudovirgaria hyperparasitica]|uniref:Uncharacterized protein n=1 Tax=Pseudovirgaria hyperparasitica TaxID=470096 RepID=A0A6A6WL69_9PEZI|nr:uncharacterized protein EJ05DRAFT_481638 [Pseudovirgaria hyperparasitica]KAF2762749.1 hypothetical protein EJ05DRAFT_481638 [Pseudovirgaria hyperparasitica]
MQYSFFLFAVGAAATAVNTTLSAAAPASSTSACDAVYNACIQRSLPSPNFAVCNSERAACESGAGVSTSIPGGCNPAHDPKCTPTPAPPAPTGNLTAKCDEVYNACIQRSLPSPNFAVCNSERAACEGGADTVVTTVVTAFTTVCPTPTTMTYNGKTYTVTASTTLTITNCPCTITHPAGQPAPTPPAGKPAPAPPAGTPASHAGTATKPAGTPSVPFFTGAAAHPTAGAMGLVALGVAALL